MTAAAPPGPHAAAVIVLDGPHILAFERLDRPGFSLPCGHIEPGESPQAAALREAEEETGLVLTLLGEAPFVALDDVGNKVVATFRAHVTGGALREHALGEGRPCWTAIRNVTTGPYGRYNTRALAHFGIEVQ